MLWIHRFYPNELGYRNDEPRKAGRHIELPTIVAETIYRDADNRVPITYEGNIYQLGFQDRPGKEDWLNVLQGLDPDFDRLLPGKIGLFFLKQEMTVLVMIDQLSPSYGDIESVFESLPRQGGKYDRVIENMVRDNEAPYETETADTVSLEEKTFIPLPKPFLLLAGISGTGKTRFVTEQAKMSAARYGLEENHNYCLVPVRPDWHDPTDITGYISRINGIHFVTTDFLEFIVRAWCSAIKEIDQNSRLVFKPTEEIPPFWLCLDEMNLAPVEQYFSDYLSAIETRKWDDGAYSCQPLLKPEVLAKLIDSSGDESALQQLWNDLFINCSCDHSLKQSLQGHFKSNGIAIPPNLIVAGTVNMDETTHGFSRKVIDRALTLDSQEFFPNVFGEFYQQSTRSVGLTFPRHTHAYIPSTRQITETITADADGQTSIEFLEGLNRVLKGTAFELAYRALNELLLSLVSFAPEDEYQLMAVWDDFLMQKVLPRIEGDTSKLRDINSKNAAGNHSLPDPTKYGSGSIIHSLYAHLSEKMEPIWNGDTPKTEAEAFADTNTRPDLLRRNAKTGDMINIPCRSKLKLEWMMTKLKMNHFTDFWV